MASGLVYTSKISVPIYVGWKCEKCRKVNLTSGHITYKREDSSSSFFKSENIRTQKEVELYAQSFWVEDVYPIVKDSNEYNGSHYSEVELENAVCAECNSKPKWHKSQKLLLLLMVISMGVAIFGGICLFSSPSNLVAWILLISGIGFFIFSIMRENNYQKMINKYPEEYAPVFGTLNQELIDYAKTRGEFIPSPDEVVDIVMNGNRRPPAPIKTTKETDDKVMVKNVKNIAKSTRICMECGAELPDNALFCKKCRARAPQVKE